MKKTLIILSAVFLGIVFVEINSLRAEVCEAEKYATLTEAGVVADNYMQKCKSDHSFFLTRLICELGCPRVAAKAARDAEAAYEACMEKSKRDSAPTSEQVTQGN